MPEILKAPFPWFGGKSRVAELVWSKFGNVPNYVEPFFGSGAVLLARPYAEVGIETINDKDCMVANFWRSVRDDPDAVAHYADWPVNEADQHARHVWLCSREKFRERMKTDPLYYDANIAGWWVWGQSLWIGAGWCAVQLPEDSTAIYKGEKNRRPHVSNTGVGVHRSTLKPKEKQEAIVRSMPMVGGSGRGVHRLSQQLPSMAAGMGVHRQSLTAPVPNLGDGGAGVHRKSMSEGIARQRPHLRDNGTGVHRKMPSMSSGMGVHRKAPKTGAGGVHAELLEYGEGLKGERLREYMRQLALRLRDVRICCGDWDRIMGPSPTWKQGLTGVFLDPPYSQEADRAVVYSAEDMSVSHKVREWAIENGGNKLMRIALCGYEGEHKMPSNWEQVEWKAHGGYGSQGKGRGRENRHRERIWFSPHCNRIGSVTFARSLFD